MSAQYREDRKPIPTQYDQLKDTTCYSCPGQCTCRFGTRPVPPAPCVNCNYMSNRSVFDQKMYQKWIMKQ